MEEPVSNTKVANLYNENKNTPIGGKPKKCGKTKKKLNKTK
jgi:hypothetical protein